MALTRVSQFIRPRTLVEAFSLLSDPRSRIIAGGIDVILFPDEATTLIDITSLPLAGVEEDGGGLRIGATTTLTELLESPAADRYLGGVVAEMLHRVAAPLQRNLGTVGGSLVIAHPWSDVITLFFALGARVTYYDGEERATSLVDFYAENVHRRRVILTGVELPPPPSGSAAAFWKFSRTAFDIALLNCAVYVQRDGAGCREVRVVIGGTPARAAFVPAAEEALVGKELSPDAIAVAAAAARDTADVRSDMRASADYRRELVAAGVRHALTQVRERLEESG